MESCRWGKHAILIASLVVFYCLCPCSPRHLRGLTNDVSLMRKLTLPYDYNSPNLGSGLNQLLRKPSDAREEHNPKYIPGLREVIRLNAPIVRNLTSTSTPSEITSISPSDDEGEASSPPNEKNYTRHIDPKRKKQATYNLSARRRTSSRGRRRDSSSRGRRRSGERRVRRRYRSRARSTSGNRDRDRRRARVKDSRQTAKHSTSPMHRHRTTRKRDYSVGLDRRDSDGRRSQRRAHTQTQQQRKTTQYDPPEVKLRGRTKYTNLHHSNINAHFGNSEPVDENKMWENVLGHQPSRLPKVGDGLKMRESGTYGQIADIIIDRQSIIAKIGPRSVRSLIYLDDTHFEWDTRQELWVVDQGTTDRGH